MMSLSQIIHTSLIKKCATFSGRATRAEYWSLILFVDIFVLIELGMLSLMGTMKQMLGKDVGLYYIVCLVVMFFCFFTILPCSSAAVRRLHDIGLSGWWWWIGVVAPLPGAFVLFVLLLLPSSPMDNKYGPASKDEEDSRRSFDDDSRRSFDEETRRIPTMEEEETRRIPTMEEDVKPSYD